MRSGPGKSAAPCSVLGGVMADQPFNPALQQCALAAGAQVVINGALVTAKSDCTLEVCPGAYLFTGRGLSAGLVRNPHQELYFSLTEVADSAEQFEQERLRLFALLSQVVLQDRDRETQEECSRCAAAMLMGDCERAAISAAQLASMRLGTADDAADADQRRVGAQTPLVSKVPMGVRRLDAGQKETPAV